MGWVVEIHIAYVLARIDTMMTLTEKLPVFEYHANNQQCDFKVCF